LNVRFANARCVVTVAPAPVVFAGATQVTFDARASSPPAGGVGAGCCPSFEDE
jgi:hypothetical protein